MSTKPPKLGVDTATAKLNSILARKNAVTNATPTLNTIKKLSNVPVPTLKKTPVAPSEVGYTSAVAKMEQILKSKKKKDTSVDEALAQVKTSVQSSEPPKSFFQRYTQINQKAGEAVGNFIYDDPKTRPLDSFSTPENISKTRSAWDALKDVKDNPQKLVPVVAGGQEVLEMKYLYDSVKNLENNTGRTEEEQRQLLYLQQYVNESSKDPTFMAQVVDVVAHLPAFAGELLVTRGIYGATKQATMKGMESALKKLLTDEGKKKLESKIAKFGIKATGVIVGSIPQALVAGTTRITAGTIENMVPEFQLTKDEAGKISGTITGDGDSAGRAIAKATVDQYIEVMSEHTGGAFDGVAGWIKKKGGALALKSSFGRAFLRVNGALQDAANNSKLVQKFDDLVKGAGWNGVLQEMMEERVGEVARGGAHLVGLSDEEYKLPTPEQLAVEFVAFLIPGASINAARYALSKGNWALAKQEIKNASDTLREDIKESYSQQGRAKTKKDLMEKTGITDSELADSILDDALNAWLGPDKGVLDEVQQALDTVTGKTPKNPTQDTRSDEKSPETIPDTVLEKLASLEDTDALQEDWNANYAQEYAQMETEAELAREQARQAPAEERKALETKASELEAQKQEKEQELISKYEPTALTDKTKRIQDALDKTKATVQQPQLTEVVARKRYHMKTDSLDSDRGGKNTTLEHDAIVTKIDSEKDLVHFDILDSDGNVSGKGTSKVSDFLNEATLIPNEYTHITKKELTDLAKSNKSLSDFRKAVLDRMDGDLSNLAKHLSGKTLEHFFTDANLDKPPKKENSTTNERTTDSTGTDPRPTTLPETRTDGGSEPAEPRTPTTEHSERMARGGHQERDERTGERSVSDTQTSTIGKTIVSIVTAHGHNLSDPDLHLSIKNEPYEPLYIERISPTELALAHTYVQNGDTMLDPEVVFDITPEGQLTAKTIETSPYPIRPISARDPFLTTWAKNLLEQGFATAPVAENATTPPDTDPTNIPEDIAQSIVDEQVADATERTQLTPEEVDIILTASTTIDESGIVSLSPSANLEEATRAASAFIPAGGRAKKGATGRGLLDEYYTPEDLTSMVGSVLDNLNTFRFPSLNVLEPSAGIGAFLSDIPADSRVTAHEINITAARALKVLNPSATVSTKPFEDTFITDRGKKKPFTPTYDLVIGNPPYGTHRGTYKGLGEEKNIPKYEEYFIKRSLDLTKPNGRVAMVVPSSILRTGGNKAKEAIASLGYLEVAYRLPNGVFDTTDIGTDILVFRRHSRFEARTPEQIGKALYTLTADNYFTENPTHILGEQTTRKGKFGTEPYVQGTLTSAADTFYSLINPSNPQTPQEWEDLATQRFTADPENFENSIEAGQIEAHKEETAREQGTMPPEAPAPIETTLDGTPSTVTSIDDLTDTAIITDTEGNTREVSASSLGHLPDYTDRVREIEAEIRTRYLSAGLLPDPLTSNSGGNYLVDERIWELNFSLSEATAGYRWQNQETLEWNGVESTFPDWIPEESRSHEALKRLYNHITTVDDIVFPTAKNAPNQRTLLNDYLHQLDFHTNVSTADIRKELMDIYWEVYMGKATVGINAREEALRAQKKTETKEAKASTTSDTPTGELLDLSTLSNASETDKTLWRNVSATGELTGNFDKTLANYENGKYYNDFTYYQGDIYQKLELLEQAREHIPAEQYTRQKEGLERVKPTPLTVDRMYTSPTTAFAQTFTIDDITLAERFITWTQSLPHQAFGYSNQHDVRNYTRGTPVRGGTKEQNEDARKYRRIEGDRLFRLFLTENLTEQEKTKVEDEFNRKFNAYARPDYTRVPLFSKVSPTYKGAPLSVKPIQLEGVSFLTNKGTGLIAHDVGVGKSMEIILSLHESMTRGWSKRPLLVVPNAQTYHQMKKDILELIPGIRLNLLSNLGANFSGDLATLTIPDNSISIVTYDGFEKLGFSPETYDDLTRDFGDAIREPNGTKTQRDQEKETTIVEGIMGRAKKGTAEEASFESLGFDLLAVDEVHNMNHIVEKAKVDKENGTTSEFGKLSMTASERGLKLWLASQYILKHNNGRNVYLASATPFTNHPLEYYSILSLMARDRMTAMGIRNVNDFMSMFMELTSKLESTASGAVKEKTDVRTFKNYQLFRSLLTEFIDFRDGEEAGVQRPNRLNRDHYILPNQLQIDLQNKAQILFSAEHAKDGGALKGIGEMRAIALSPYLSKFYTGPTPDYKTFVENSPKLLALVNTIALTRSNATHTNGQLVYSPIGAGKKSTGDDGTKLPAFELIKEYLMKEKGYGQVHVVVTEEKIDGDWIETAPQRYASKTEAQADLTNRKNTRYFDDKTLRRHKLQTFDEVSLITGATDKAKRVVIQDAFNRGIIKVVLGSDAIKEGVNLQENTTDLYIISLPWNFTQLRQVHGRAWRQGNRWPSVRINNFYTQDSVDVFLSQKLQNKQDRYEQMLSFKGDILDVGDIDFEELKSSLITDPVARIQYEAKLEEETIKNELTRTKADIAYQNRKFKQYHELAGKVKSYKDNYEEYRDRPDHKRTADYYKEEYENLTQKLNALTSDLKSRGIDVVSLQETTTATQTKIDQLQAKLDTFKSELEDRIKTATTLKNETTATAKKFDMDGFLAERNTDDSQYFQDSPTKDLRLRTKTDTLASKINKRQWWRTAVNEEGARERGMFYMGTYREAEFYGRPIDTPFTVQVSNPLAGSETHILETLKVPPLKELHELKDIFAQDRLISEKAIAQGYDSIVLMSPSGYAKYLETGALPRSIELNDLTNLLTNSTRGSTLNPYVHETQSRQDGRPERGVPPIVSGRDRTTEETRQGISGGTSGRQRGLEGARSVPLRTAGDLERRSRRILGASQTISSLLLRRTRGQRGAEAFQVLLQRILDRPTKDAELTQSFPQELAQELKEDLRTFYADTSNLLEDKEYEQLHDAIHTVILTQNPETTPATLFDVDLQLMEGLGTPEPVLRTLREAYTHAPRTIQERFHSLLIARDNPNIDGGLAPGAHSWKFYLNIESFYAPDSITHTPSIIYHEIYGHGSYAYAREDFKAEINRNAKEWAKSDPQSFMRIWARNPNFEAFATNFKGYIKHQVVEPAESRLAKSFALAGITSKAHQDQLAHNILVEAGMKHNVEHLDGRIEKTIVGPTTPAEIGNFIISKPTLLRTIQEHAPFLFDTDPKLKKWLHSHTESMADEFYSRYMEDRHQQDVVPSGLRNSLIVDQKRSLVNQNMEDFFHGTSKKLDADNHFSYRLLRTTENRHTNMEDFVHETYTGQDRDAIKRDINTVEYYTAQAHDIYLKDTRQFTAMKLFESVATTRRTKKSALDQKFSQILEPYFTLPPAQRTTVDEILHLGDESATEYDEKALSKWKLSPEQITAYYSVRTAFNTGHELMLQKMREQAVPEDEINEFKNTRKGYMPHKWPFKYAVKTVEDGANGLETVAMTTYKSEKEARTAWNQLRTENTNTRISYVLETLDSLEVDFFTEQRLSFNNLKIMVGAAKTSAEVKEEMLDAFRSMSKEKGFGRHYLRRGGVRGYDTAQTPKHIADYISGLNGFLTKMEASKGYFEALETLDPRKQKRAYAWLRDTIAYDLRGDDWTENAARWPNAITYTYMLALDVSYLATNATQNLTVGLGELSKYLSGKQKIIGPEKYLLGALKDWTVQRITPDEKEVVTQLIALGRLGGQEAAEYMNFKNNVVYRNIAHGINKLLYSSTAFVETHINRVPTFLAARRILIDQGLSPKEANEKALSITEDIHFRYGKQNRAKYERGAGKSIFLFTHYIRSFFYLMLRNAKHDRAALARQITYTFILGGTTALPFAKLIIELWRKLAEEDGDDDEKKEIGKWEIAITRGLPALIGVDLSGRVSIDVFSLNAIFEKPTDIRSYIGAVGGIGTRFYQGISLLTQQRYLEAFGKLTPDVLANPLKAIQGYNYGVYSFPGNPLETPEGDVYKYNTWEAIIRATGYTPTSEGVLWDEKSKQWILADKETAERTKVRRTIVGMVNRGDYDQAREYQAQAIEQGTMDESTDYVRQFGKKTFTERALTAVQTGTDERTAYEAFLKDLYGDTATEQQKNNVKKEFKTYLVFGTDNETVNDLLKATTNKDKVEILQDARASMTQEEWDDFIKKARSTVTLESGRKSHILISDDLADLYKKSKTK